MKLSEKQQIFTENIGKLIAKACGLNIRLTFGEAYRTNSQQLLYFYGQEVVQNQNDRLALRQAKKRSWTRNSRHLNRLAVDFNFFVDGKLTYEAEKIELLGEYWESLDTANLWGGHWHTKDVPHFEMKP